LVFGNHVNWILSTVFFNPSKVCLERERERDIERERETLSEREFKSHKQSKRVNIHDFSQTYRF